MDTPQHFLILEIVSGGPEKAVLTFALGAAVQPFGMGPVGDWRVETGAPLAGAFFCFDGWTFYARSADAEWPLRIDDWPVPAAWTPVAGPARLFVGTTRLHLHGPGLAPAAVSARAVAPPVVEPLKAVAIFVPETPPAQLAATQVEPAAPPAVALHPTKPSPTHADPDEVPASVAYETALDKTFAVDPGGFDAARAAALARIAAPPPLPASAEPAPATTRAVAIGASTVLTAETAAAHAAPAPAPARGAGTKTQLMDVSVHVAHALAAVTQPAAVPRRDRTLRIDAADLAAAASAASAASQAPTSMGAPTTPRMTESDRAPSTLRDGTPAPVGGATLALSASPLDDVPTPRSVRARTIAMVMPTVTVTETETETKTLEGSLVVTPRMEARTVAAEIESTVMTVRRPAAVAPPPGVAAWPVPMWVAPRPKPVRPRAISVEEQFEEAPLSIRNWKIPHASPRLLAIGAILLVIVLLVRPHEVIPALDGIGLLNIVFGFGALVAIGELVTSGGALSSWASPQLPWIAAFVLWTYVATIRNLGFGPAITEVTVNVLYSALFGLIVMAGGRSFLRFQTLAVVLLGITVFLCGVSIAQVKNGFECISLEVDAAGHADTSVGEPTGGSCDNVLDCEKTAVSSRMQFECERPGPFGTFSTGHGRVRWRGKLADPNEMALCMGASLPFLFAWHRQSKRKVRHVVLAALLGLVGYTIILSGSRGGVLVLIIVAGTYFVRSQGAKGVLLAGVGALPLLMLGSRSSEEADSSANERVGLLYDGIDMIKQFPLFGVGQNQFQEHAWPPLTAHNSYVLAASELGLPGMLLWTALMYLTCRIPLEIFLRPPQGMDPRLHEYAFALLVSLGGFLVGIFFLSFCFHPLLFIYIGLTGALFCAVRVHAPHFKIPFTPKQVGALFLVDIALLAGIFVYTRVKGGS